MKILNFGSLNIDYVYEVDEFVKKGETISSKLLRVFAGGKGLNQSIALSRAGANVYHAGVVGDDGVFLINLLKESGVNTSFVDISHSVRTGNAIIQNDRFGDNCIILYGGANQSITRQKINEVLDFFDKGDWLVLQNEINEMDYLIRKAYARGMNIVLNPSPLNEKIRALPLQFIHCFILNEGEGKALLEGSGEKMGLAEELYKKFSHAEIVLTLGENGSVYVGEEGKVQQKAYKVEVVDTTAAGDTFTGYYLAERLRGASVQEALDLASKASAYAVSKRGAAPSIPKRSELVNEKEDE